MKIIILNIIFLFSTLIAFSQTKDSVNTRLLYSNLTFDAVAMTGSYLALNELWYKDYEQTKLHWFNDADEWLQVDKLGHTFSTYHISSLCTEQMRWSGLNKTKSAVVGTGMGFLTISAIELFDAKSKNWGASATDLAANALGSGLYLIQQLAWKEQKLILKYSFSPTGYAERRSDLLGSSFSEQILKDYNGQTYWLSANIASFTKVDWMPEYLNVAFGYGASGMLGGKSNPENLSHFERERQYYFSLDIDLRKIPVKSKFLKAAFSVFNILKIPMPTIELRSGKLYGHYLYF